MKIRDILKYNDSDLNEILKFILNLDLLKNLDYALSIKEERKYKLLKKRLDKKEPVEYITKKVYFHKYEFFVNKNVLIPRQDTQSILPYLLKYNSVLDIGTGSGAVGISTKKENPNISVTLSDISERALYVAKKNAKGLDIKIVKSDLTKNINIKNFECIFANLPYIKDIDKLPDSVKLYEPFIALYGGSNGIVLIKKLIKELKDKKWIGDLYLELDPFQIKYISCNKEIIKDQYKIDRFIKIKF